MPGQYKSIPNAVQPLLQSEIIILRLALIVAKYTLALIGAVLLVELFRDRWGWATTLWLFGAPFVYGILNTLTARK